MHRATDRHFRRSAMNRVHALAAPGTAHRPEEERRYAGMRLRLERSARTHSAWEDRGCSQPRTLVETECQVHCLDCLTSSSLHQIIDSDTHLNLTPVGTLHYMKHRVVGSNRMGALGRFIEHAYEWPARVGIAVPVRGVR